MLARLGRAASTHKWWFLGAWLLLLIGLAVAGRQLPHGTKDVFTIPGSESQAALDLLEEREPDFAAETATVVFQAKSGSVTDTDNAAAISQTVKNLSGVKDVASVEDPTQSPYDEFLVSSDKTISYTTVRFSDEDAPKNTFDKLEKAAEPATKAGLRVEYGGALVDAQNPPPPGLSKYADDLGVLMAAVILLLAFGSVVAMGLPLGTALGGLGASAGTLAVLEHFFTIGTINPEFGQMLGLGVGIDYSLLILNRYLQDRAEGADIRDGVGGAISTAGRAVIFAGLTICIATTALITFGIPYLTTLGFTSAMYVAIMVIAALTLLPALLGLAGNHVESIRLPFIKRRSEVDPNDPTTIWGRWARTVTAHPWVFGTAGIVLLVIVAIPFRDADLGFTDDGDQPTSVTQRQAYDLLAEGFGAGVNGPLLVTVDLPGTKSSDETADNTAVTALDTALGKTKGVASVAPAIPDNDGTLDVIVVTPSTGPSDPATKQLVRDLRSDVIPKALDGTSLSADKVEVGGQTAELIDFSDQVSDRLPFFIGVVLVAAFAMLMILFRALLVPLKAVLLNLLMFLAVYGLIVAVFQWGWMKDLVGLEETVPIESFVPLIVFAVIFGLSTDYEVFLVSRIREQYDRTDDPTEAVVLGMTSTARVIASAVLIMACVFLSFAANPDALVKMIGFALGVGILLDGFIVRLVIVPALLKLMGRRAWWMPHWLGRVLPKVSLEQ
jgi:RND superfamily putative drug exporter